MYLLYYLGQKKSVADATDEKKFYLFFYYYVMLIRFFIFEPQALILSPFVFTFVFTFVFLLHTLESHHIHTVPFHLQIYLDYF